MSQTLEQKFQWNRVIGFGKVIHLIIDIDNVQKTVCGHNVSNYPLKSNKLGKKCGLCENIKNQYENSLMQKERFDIDYMPSEAFRQSRYS